MKKMHVSIETCIFGTGTVTELIEKHSKIKDFWHTECAFIAKKLVATANRCECVYKRTGEPSVTFCERGRAAE